MKTINSIEQINIAADLGASGSVAIAEYKGKETFVYLSPYVQKVSRQQILSKIDFLQVNSDLNDEAIRIEDAGELFALGQLALDINPYCDQSQTQKWEKAIPKIQALIGKALSQLGLLKESRDTKLSVNLYLLLPITESKQKELLKSALTDSLLFFKYCDVEIELTLTDFTLRAESTGICSFLNQLGVSKTNVFSIACGGHRDINLYSFQGGSVKGVSRNIGFYDFVNQLAQDIAFEHPYELLPSIKENGWFFNPEAFYSLFEGLASSLKEAALTNFVQSLSLRQKEFLNDVSDLIHETLPKETTHLITTGGSFQYLNPVVPKDQNATSPLDSRLSLFRPQLKVIKDTKLYPKVQSKMGAFLKSNSLHPTQVLDLLGTFELMMYRLNA